MCHALCAILFCPVIRRVGLLPSQYTNRGKTCDVDGGLPVCRPLILPERMCALPWEKR